MPVPDMNPAPVPCASCRRELSASALFCPNCGTPRSAGIGKSTGVVDELLGAVLGERFLIVDRLGAGKSGIIYRGEHVTLRRKVAIKVLHHELSRDDLAIERFRREATSVAEIDNEHIVEIHDFGRTADGRLYLAMELLEGETLDTILAREGTLSFERTIDVLVQVAEALVDAHAVGFVHRDLRPRNIFLSVRRGKANFVKLLDFGLSKLVETGGGAASTSLGMTFGDPRYMSPEQAKGDSIDRRADLYSLGCIAFEMLTGEPPFVGGKVFDVLTRHVNERPASVRGKRADVPLWLDAAIARTLAKSSSDRFLTAAKLVEVLRGAGAVSMDGVPEAVPVPVPVPVPMPVPVPGSLSVAPSGPTPTSPPVAPSGPTPTSPPVAPSGPTPTSPPPQQDSASGTLPGTGPASSVSESGRRGPTGTPAVGVPAVDPASLAPTATAPTATAPVAAAPIVPTVPAPVAAAPIPAAPMLAEPTASERVSIPIATADAASGPTTLPAETTDRVRRSTGPVAGSSSRVRRATGPSDDANLSGAWFADGDGADLNESGAASLQRSRGFIDPGDSLFDDDRRPRSRAKPFLIAGGLATVAIVAILALGGGKKKPTPDRAVAVPAVIVDAAVVDPTTILDAGMDPPDAVGAIVTPPVGRTPTSGGSTARTSPTPIDRTRTTGGTLDDPGRRPGLIVDETPAPATGNDEQKQLAEFYAKAGDAALRGGDPVGAAGNFQKALAANPANVDAVIGLGEVAVAQGVYTDALRQLKKAAKLAPKRARVHILLGEAYLNTGNASAAESAFKKALQLDPGDTRAINGYNEATSRLPPVSDEF